MKVKANRIERATISTYLDENGVKVTVLKAYAPRPGERTYKHGKAVNTQHQRVPR